jgi:hypothetical protein
MDWLRDNWIKRVYLTAGVKMMHSFLEAEFVIRSERIDPTMFPKISVRVAHPLPSIPRASQAGECHTAQRRFPVTLEKSSTNSIVSNRLARHLLPMEMQLDKRLLSGQP